jgi:DNA-binding transcriptional MerR regulator/methylmalonyl-CoA mutase cobalamin-binding subunit
MNCPRQLLDAKRAQPPSFRMAPPHHPVPDRTTAREHGHPIQVVARRTGLSTDVIRAWEKRHGVVTPVRTEAGRRLYSDADVDRLRLLARATLTGRTIGQVASLPPATLEALLDASDAAAPPAADLPRSRAALETLWLEQAADHLAVALDAVDRCDVDGLHAVLRRAAVALSADAFLDALVVPFWEQVDVRVRAGTWKASRRLLALAVLRRMLDRVAEAAAAPLLPRALLVTTLSSRPAEEIGALLATATAAAEGWRVIYIGACVPAEEIAQTAFDVGATAVAVSLGDAPGDRATLHELRRLRSALPDGVAVLLEGLSVDASASVAREIGAVVARDLASLRSGLQELTHPAPVAAVPNGVGSL